MELRRAPTLQLQHLSTLSTSGVIRGCQMHMHACGLVVAALLRSGTDQREAFAGDSADQRERRYEQRGHLRGVGAHRPPDSRPVLPVLESSQKNELRL